MAEAYKVIKNGLVWDYSTYRSDCWAWEEWILREEPNAVVETVEASRAEMMAWKEY